MRRLSAALALTAVFLFGGEVQGQETSSVDLEQELRALVAEPPAVELDQQVVLDFLSRAEVDELAGKRGLDLEHVHARLGSLDGETVAALARHLERAEDDEAIGGNTIVLSTTTVIIILLILILVT